ncbi:hypothetical protein Lbir_0103 [Legionella birminghamensis]|uniref:Uncharacterized protein n=1 Tax=Legionella birminghamensis TaxID=28083 RepID=A0A378I709_9GAMM|nr:CBU_0585 family protein [Legionella birminghamensis]KTC76034.1 hypothetical protein Lbir_0103 [Legionella birminghamensis]STX30803.1 Uncharacterised protein [Legionella birminghamensis]
MSKNDIDKAYVSPIDKFLFQFDAEHEKSASQKKEIKKHKRIFYYRDHAKRDDNKEEIWEDF